MNAPRTTSKHMGRAAGSLAAAALLLSLMGCTVIAAPLAPVAPPPGYPFLTGNWEFSTSATTGSQTFGFFRGYINERSVNPGVDDPTTASLQLEGPTNCFLGTLVDPFVGDTKADALTLNSFTDVSQFINITATRDAKADHLTGTYSVGGGCASGSKGTLLGTRYSALTGNYSGPSSGGAPPATINLNLTQSSFGNGDGTLNVTGSAAVGANACFPASTLTVQRGYVLGSTVNLLFTTGAASGSPQVQLTGTFDPAATQITAATIDVSQGQCSTSIGPATLLRQ